MRLSSSVTLPDPVDVALRVWAPLWQVPADPPSCQECGEPGGVLAVTELGVFCQVHKQGGFA
jgi:hypothetical protein